MTDDPSTNSGEWVCRWMLATPATACTAERPHTAAPVWGCGYVTPSPVQDSERPGYQPPEFIRCDWCGRHGHCGNVICEVCAEKAAAPVPSPVPRRPDTAKLREPGYLAGSAIWAQRRKEAADWIDAHRCPTPEPEFYGRLVCASCGQVPSAHIGPVGNYCPGPLPTPEGDVLAELRAAWETTQGAGRTVLILDAVDRLLASHPGGEA